MPRLPKISVVGTGSTGAALCLALSRLGYPVASLVNRTGAPAKQLARKVGCRRVSTSPADVAGETDILIIAVPDDAIAGVASDIARTASLRWKHLFAFHLSGARTSDELAPLRKKGALVASVHPIQTFPASSPVQKRAGLFRGIWFGTEGEQKAAERAGELTGRLGGRQLIVRKEHKTLYHVASVFASNYFVVLLNAIHELAISAEMYVSWTELFGPLMTASMEHALRDGPADALTGPVVRGDLVTIDRHLAELTRRMPHLLPIYAMCGIEVARIRKQNGRIGQAEYDKILSAFRQRIVQQPKRHR
ncbi:MAG TPA: Rossmann-like and DUF2520 domain-containing protein [Bacteroidota bacterium]|nr:Rossmann-like and DUF2520 domain-containing protein [Bacteroidota bacterium]